MAITAVRDSRTVVVDQTNYPSMGTREALRLWSDDESAYVAVWECIGASTVRFTQIEASYWKNKFETEKIKY